MSMVLLLIFSNLILITGNVCSQESKTNLSRSKIANILQLANAEYDKSRYALAARDYEKYLKEDANPPKIILSRLADCYWQIRAKDDALRVYKLLFPNGKDGADAQQRVRIAELYARSGMYKEAAKWLQGINGYKEKADVYNRRLKLELLKRDSLCWKVDLCDINNQYRNYSPFLLDSTLFFSSTKPLPVARKISNWDGAGYSRLLKVPLSKVHIEQFDSLNSTQVLKKKKNEIVTTKSLARLYEGADVRSIQNEVYFRENNYYISSDKDTSDMIDKELDDNDFNTTGIYIDKNNHINFSASHSNTSSMIVGGLDHINFNTVGISIDKNNHVYFSANYSKNKNKVNRMRLMEGVYSLNSITKVHALPFGDAKSYSVMLPTVSNDGNILVFCSDKSGGKGNVDLYYSLRDTVKQKWGIMKPFPGNINTVGNDLFPTITQDDYLYFSNDSRPGLGGLDIFRIKLKDAIEGTGEPTHLSYPINSSSDDFGWTIDASGANGFISSDRLNNRDNLYSFVYKEYNKVRVIAGYVRNELTKEPIFDATIFMLNNNTGEVTIARTDKNGRYEFIVNSSDKVIIKVMKKGMSNDYLIDEPIKGTVQLEDTITKKLPDLLSDKQPDSENDFSEQKDDSVDFSDTESEQLNDSTLKIIQNRMYAKQNYKINNSWRLNNILYDYNKAELREESKPMLDSLINMLKKLPLKVELSSHTDSRGTDEYNDKLSQQRAESVVNYLIEHGIDRKRVLAKGFGKRHLLNKCEPGVPCSEAEQQLNRRTEVRVMGYSHKEKKYRFDPSKYYHGEVIDKSLLPKDFFDN